MGGASEVVEMTRTMMMMCVAERKKGKRNDT